MKTSGADESMRPSWVSWLLRLPEMSAAVLETCWLCR